MKILKLNNYVKLDGACDYKGLNIEQFVAGSQLYPSTSTCYIKTEQSNIELNDDLIEINETEYDEVLQSLKSQDNSLTTDAKLELIQKALDDLLLLGGL